ncbi:MAG: LLM class flavin-dependent oxidoreductase [Acidobacteriota bacterium]
MPLRLSVLDQAPVPQGQSSGDALRNSLDLARLTDLLGYTRYWLAEHHGAASLACASPEVMIGPVAAATRHMRIGSGGIMLPHYSPLKVAESFSMLAGLYPNRIDLGIGRAAGTTARIAHALQRDQRHPPADDFPRQLAELMAYLSNRHPLLPGHFESPELWLLGSSSQSAEWAAELGLSYTFADFINPEGAPYTSYYRQAFTPSAARAKPRTAVAVSVICAATDAEAMRLSASLRVMLLMLFRGRTIPVPPVDEAEAVLRAEGLPFEAIPAGRRFVTGSPATVRRQLENLASDYGAEELLLVTNVFDHQARRRSYELLAAEFALAAPSESQIESQSSTV